MRRIRPVLFWVRVIMFPTIARLFREGYPGDPSPSPFIPLAGGRAQLVQAR